MSDNRNIARAAGVVGTLTLVSRFAGLLRDVVIGSLFGSSMPADAFFVAFRIPNMLRRFVAEGAASVAIVPVLSDYLANRSRQETLHAAGVLLGGAALVLLTITAIGMLLTPQWVAILAPGFAADPARFQLTTQLTRWLLPYVLLVGLVALMGGLLNAMQHFAAPALAPVLLNLAIISTALALTPFLKRPIFALVVGVLVGGILQIVAQIVALGRRGIRLWPVWDPAHPALRRVARLLVPASFGAAAYQLNVVFGTILASALPSGSISFLWYADRIFELPVGLFAVALGTAALPSFAGQAVRGAHEEMRRSLAFATSAATFIAVPAMVGLVVLAEPIVRVLFERGSFGEMQVVMTADALRMYAVGLWAVSISRVLVPAFYALGDARTPVMTGVAAVVSNVIFSLMFMGSVPGGSVQAGTTGVVSGWLLDSLAAASDRFGLIDLRHAGLALATSLAATVNVLLLLGPLRRRFGTSAVAGIFGSLARALSAALVMAVPVWWLAASVDWGHMGGSVRRATLLVGIIAVGVVVYAVAARLAGCPETHTGARMIRERRWRS